MELDPKKITADAVYKLLIGCVVPRPIAWVSTVDAAGVKNVAPFSFFMAITGDPPTLAFSSGARKIAPGTRAKKDTLANAEATGGFVVNVVDDALAEAMNLTSGEYPPEVDEFAMAGLESAPGVMVQAPRVGAADVHARPLADGLQPFEHGNVGAAVARLGLARPLQCLLGQITPPVYWRRAGRGSRPGAQGFTGSMRKRQRLTAADNGRK